MTDQEIIDARQALINKYPKILGGRGGYPGVGPGWFPLIDRLCKHLQFNTDHNDHLEKYKNQVVAAQIKEKFGGLRFYTNGATDVQQAAIDFAESMSYTICEECGAPGKARNDGWIKTLCDKHAK